MAKDAKPYDKRMDLVIAHDFAQGIKGLPDVIPFLLKSQAHDVSIFKQVNITYLTNITEITIKSQNGLGHYINTDGEVMYSPQNIHEVHYSVLGSIDIYSPNLQ